MRVSTYRSTWPVAAIVGTLLLVPRAHASESDPAALAAAAVKAPTTPEKGRQASEKSGRPNSAKFEIEDGKLQLSVYTMAADGHTEVLFAPDTSNVIKAEKIADADGLKAAAGQKAAMEKASASLIAATGQAVQRNTESRAVSVFPALESGHAMASVTL